MINPGFKLIVAVIAISTLLLFPFAVARAAGSIMYILKEFGLDVAARVITRMLETKLSDGMVKKMLKLGRGGGPAFIQDWRTFLSTAQYRGEDITRGVIADAVDTTICPYMGPSIASIFNAQLPIPDPYKYRVDSLQYYKLRNRCSLPSGLNVDAFRNDFNQGGWEAWGELIQPQNNFYGVYGDSISELTSQRTFEQGIDTSEAISGNGNTSARAPCVGEGMNKQCTVMGLIITPGTVFSQNEAATINKEMDWLISADELSEVVANLTTSVLSRLEDYAAGAVLSGPAAGNNYDASGALGQAKQDCVNSCIVAKCPAALAACNIDTSNRPCAPADPDPRDACVSSCQQTQGCQ